MKNIIFLMTDQHRLDHVSYHGKSAMETPHIDRIAQSAGFTKCQTVNPICTPARTALLTGKYSHQIGTLAMSGDLSLQHPTYLQALQKAGYHTSGIGKFHFLQTWKWNLSSGNHLDLVAQKGEIAKYGFDYIWEAAGKQLSRQNYCDYMKYLDEKGLMETYRSFVDTAGSNPFQLLDAHDDIHDGDPSPLKDEDYVDIKIGDQIVNRIKNRPQNAPFFIFGSFCSPHKPMDPPSSFLDQIPYEEIDDFITDGEEIPDEHKKKLYKRRRSYKAMIKLVDDQVGRIFETLEREGILNDTVILFTSDHGEMMGDHLKIQKSSWYKEASTVPTAIRHPDYLHNFINHNPVEITDLTATILDVAGLKAEEVLSKDWPAFHNIVPCKSLLPILRGETDRIRDFSFSECNGQWQMIQDDRYKYAIELNYDKPGEAKEYLFDTVSDRVEQNNLVDNKKSIEILSLMRERRHWVNDATPPAQTRWAKLSEEGEAYSYGNL
jgi:arylsulfatase